MPSIKINNINLKKYIFSISFFIFLFLSIFLLPLTMLYALFLSFVDLLSISSNRSFSLVSLTTISSAVVFDVPLVYFEETPLLLIVIFPAVVDDACYD